MEAKLAILGADGRRSKNGQSFSAKGITFTTDARGEIPIWLEANEHDHDFAHIVGACKPSIHNDIVWVDARILDDKIPGSLVKILYPHPIYKVMKRKGDTIQEMKIEGINLSSAPPLDDRIATLAQQGVVARKRG